MHAMWTLISFLLFTALVAVIFSWKTRGDDLESAEGYFLPRYLKMGAMTIPSLMEVRYLYAMAVLFPIELVIMWALNKYRPAEEYVPQDVGAVDLTPWKYRHVVSMIGLILAVVIYIVFSPLGIAA